MASSSASDIVISPSSGSWEGTGPSKTSATRRSSERWPSGLRKGDQGRHLITFHPSGGQSSAQWFHNDAWLDFNMIQSGHGYDHPNYERIAADYSRKPVKPCMDAEPGYEDHPAEFNAKNGYLDDYETRKHAYWRSSPALTVTRTAAMTSGNSSGQAIRRSPPLVHLG